MSKVVLATTTFYPTVDHPRFKEGAQTLKKAADAGIPMIVVDGSLPEVRERLRAAGGMTCTVVEEVKTEKGVFGPARRQAFRLLAERFDQGCAAGGWIEPEKHDELRFIQRLTTPIISGQVDGVVPQRSGLSFRYYPLFQESCERLGNLAFQDMTGIRLDAWHGPRFFNRRFLRYFLDYAGEYGDKWDSIFIPVIRALHAGLNIVSVEIDYRHPPGQLVEEEENPELKYDKRLQQLVSLVTAMRQECQRLGMLREAGPSAIL